jgi:regulator of RNase E activity RraA
LHGTEPDRQSASPAQTQAQSLFDTIQTELYSGVISDILDSLGYRDQAMYASIRPVYPGAVVVGRAHTVLSSDVYAMPEDRYSMEIKAVDSLKPGDVMVASTNQSTRTCLWGELLSTAARARGARGAVIDGHTRDVRQIERMQFPVFSTGMRPVDSAGRGLVIAYGEPVVCGGVLVNPGDIIFGDIDGVVVIPKDVEEQVITGARQKVTSENRSRADLEKGDYLRDVYERYGVL